MNSKNHAKFMKEIDELEKSTQDFINREVKNINSTVDFINDDERNKDIPFHMLRGIKLKKDKKFEHFKLDADPKPDNFNSGSNPTPKKSKDNLTTLFDAKRVYSYDQLANKDRFHKGKGNSLNIASNPPIEFPKEPSHNPLTEVEEKAKVMFGNNKTAKRRLSNVTLFSNDENMKKPVQIKDVIDVQPDFEFGYAVYFIFEPRNDNHRAKGHFYYIYHQTSKTFSQKQNNNVDNSEWKKYIGTYSVVECTNKNSNELLIEVNLTEKIRYKKINKIEIEVKLVMGEQGLRFKNGYEYEDLEFVERVKRIEATRTCTLKESDSSLNSYQEFLEEQCGIAKPKELIEYGPDSLEQPKEYVLKQPDIVDIIRKVNIESYYDWYTVGKQIIDEMLHLYFIKTGKAPISKTKYEQEKDSIINAWAFYKYTGISRDWKTNMKEHKYY